MEIMTRLETLSLLLVARFLPIVGILGEIMEIFELLFEIVGRNATKYLNRSDECH